MSPPLGDAFPQAFKDQQSREIIRPGSVFRAFTKDTNPPKIKRFVILGLDKGSVCVGVLYINTEINTKKFPSDYLKSLHMPLQVQDCDFLEHDSYLDCSYLYEWPLESLRTLFVNDTGVYLGDLGEEVLLDCRRIVVAAKTISRAIKKKFELL